MEKHFVEFFSPGTFVSESTDVPIDSWNVQQAVALSHDIKERHNSTPYGFMFITKSRNDDELDSKVTKRSNFYFLGGKIETYKEVCERNDPNEETLRWNMKTNKYKRIITNTNSWKITLPLNEDDIVLENI